MHSGLGIEHGVNEPVASKFAARGYAAVCTDMYGAHLAGAPMQEAGRAMVENVNDPTKHRARTVAWFDAVAARPDIDAERIAAVGFCYGGMTVLELARSGANVKAAVSYHGTLKTHARAERGAIRAHVVAYCGASDPFAPLEDVDALRKEMQDAGASSYQITIFGAAAHGFTDPDAATLNLDGVRYDPLSNELALSGTFVLLQHLFDA
jgi:dienelactone hydrolase